MQARRHDRRPDQRRERQVRQHALAYRASRCTELVAVCDVDPARAKTLAREVGARSYGSLERMLAEMRPHLLSVVTPDAHHVEPTLAALDAGCHVLVEKPIALELDDARRMIDAARRAERVLAVDFNAASPIPTLWRCATPR